MPTSTYPADFGGLSTRCSVVDARRLSMTSVRRSCTTFSMTRSLPSHFTPAPAGCVPNAYLLVTPADVVELINALPDKQSATDPLLIWLLKRSADVLAPFLCQLFNLSLQQGCVPWSFEASYNTPLLKKAGLDPANVRFYRPISNLTVISKLLERIVSSQLVKYQG